MFADVLLRGLGILFLGQLASPTILVSTGDDFVSAVRKFGREGGQLELQLDTAAAAISVANATWSVEEQQQGFNGGTLLITAAPSEDGKPGVLDAAMKSGLAPEATEPTVQIWRDIVFINLCSKELDYNPSIDYEGLVANNMYLMPRNMVGSRVQRRDSVVYTTFHEYSGLVYWVVDWESQVDVAHLGVFSMTVDFWSTAGGEDFNVTFRATNNPHDPLEFMLPEFGGSLMPHRLCAADGNSSDQFLPEEMVNPSYPFLWMVDGSAQLRDALRSMSQSKLTDQRFGEEDPVAIATILDDVSVADGGDVLEQIPLQWDVLLNGPPSLRRPVLDFADKEDVLSMDTADLKIFIRNLELRGLKSTAILNEDGTASTQSTSLQLAAIAHRDRQLLHMHGVTLEVAKSDFLRLLSAARRGSQWKSGAPADAHLLEPITVWKPVAFNRSVIEFEEYSGWGIEGKDIRFVSATPVLDSEVLMAPQSQGDKDEVALGVGIGVGVGGGLILIAILIGLAVVRKRRISRMLPGDWQVGDASQFFQMGAGRGPAVQVGQCQCARHAANWIRHSAMRETRD
ncbi:hypothetical protein DUNSADRAFT_15743 [Dunaliella salina]|uniref:Uncharacterized protein n=1 Tax=Dunaliella salina TaxID=3046 RepID=A0ABQ7H9B8_DUNSA|nr:hypothetical protein DUNSADRAFT_15743 [Dunaliella salina]|eukprot:KAF5843449.1 hypothetical protein DUNSADRAFT_15743 [Dunaliella salina]